MNRAGIIVIHRPTVGATELRGALALALGAALLFSGCADQSPSLREQLVSSQTRVNALEAELAEAKANEEALEAALAEANQKIEDMNSRILDAQGALYRTYREQEEALEDLEEEDPVDDPR